MTHSLRLVFACLLSISVAALPIHAQHTPEEIKGTAKITGKVIDSDGDEVRGARVLAVHLSSSRVFAGEPSRANGEYVITGLPYGYFDLAVEIAEEIYVSNRVVNVPSGDHRRILPGTPVPIHRWSPSVSNAHTNSASVSMISPISPAALACRIRPVGDTPT